MALSFPYDGNTIDDLKKRVLLGKHAQLPSKYSDNLRSLCLQMMSLVPTDRPTIQSIFNLGYVKDHINLMPNGLFSGFDNEIIEACNEKWQDPKTLS